MKFLLFLLALVILMGIGLGAAEFSEAVERRQWMEYSATHHCHIKALHDSSFAGEQRDLYECDGFEILH